MTPTLEYLSERYSFWKNEIGREGIWNPDLFGEIVLELRPKSKSYNGLFSRKHRLIKGKRVPVDKIAIYRNSEDFEASFLDSVLVHEMIHQYIFQNKIKDTSTHGQVFKSFMVKINTAFEGKLSIKIKDHNPSIPEAGPGDSIHTLVFTFSEDYFFCCVVNAAKIRDFERLLKRHKSAGRIKKYYWAQSNDVYFDRFTRCTKNLHGLKMPVTQLFNFCSRYNINKI